MRHIWGDHSNGDHIKYFLPKSSCYAVNVEDYVFIVSATNTTGSHKLISLEPLVTVWEYPHLQEKIS